MTRKCIACGMPMVRPVDSAGGDTTKAYGRHCARPDGAMKSREEVLEVMAGFFVKTQDIDPKAARQAAESAMATLPAWRET